MNLRELKLEDAPKMLEWMHDDNVTKYMDTSFLEKNIEDCHSFISESRNKEKNYHLAICKDDNNYIGTVSLKNIDRINKNAEFAMTVCSDAMGQGYARCAMKSIIKIGFEKLGLEQIYWYVSKENIRAIRFYNKNGYIQIHNRERIKTNITQFQFEKYFWYQIERLKYKNKA